jgi:hypothetical protein
MAATLPSEIDNEEPKEYTLSPLQAVIQKPEPKQATHHKLIIHRGRKYKQSKPFL